MHALSHSQRTVLVVDDDPAIRDMLKEVLEDAGYHVMSAENGNQALIQLRQASRLPGLILLDLMMPVMTGWEFRAEQKADQALAHIPVIVLSARPSLHHGSFPTIVDEFIAKPLDIVHLLMIVERYCQVSSSAK